MEKWEKYFFQPKSTNDILENAAVFIDTNVLLSAYQWREVTVKEVINVLKILNDEGRLKIPLQVIKEFARNRPKEIVQRMNELEEAISKLQKPSSLTQKVPMLEGAEIYERVKELQDSYEEGLKNYKKGLMELRDELKRLFYEDHILIQLQEIFKTAVFNPPDIKSEDDLNKEAQKRFKNQQPPGYKDSSKEENSAGDYIIWANMLELKQDVIFVSNEKKPDWVYTDKHKNTISVRRELTEEFFEISGGHTFGYLSPKDLITLLRPDVSEEVKEDLDVNIKLIPKAHDETYDKIMGRVTFEEKIAKIIFEEDPLSIAQAVGSEDEYLPEAKAIVEEINDVLNNGGLLMVPNIVEIIHNVFIRFLDERLAGPKDRYRAIAVKIWALIAMSSSKGRLQFL